MVFLVPLVSVILARGCWFKLLFVLGFPVYFEEYSRMVFKKFSSESGWL